jgi:FKBP-type peptidyl-prolyl cis-trans isomerase SlyD
MVVTIHYSLRNDAGDVLDTSEGDAPMSYLHGAGNIVPGLEKELAGKSAGDKLHAVVTPDEAYGTRTGPGPQPVPRDQFPDDADLETGMQILARGPGDQQFALWVVDVNDESVLLDHNHPLAGETLHFDVEVMAVRSATEEELSHQHPHGPDGHGHH